MGKLVGRNMDGAHEPYTDLRMVYSDLFELGYEAVGEINSRMQIVTDWQDSINKGVIYYLENGRVRGVILRNVWGQVDNARALMAEAGSFKAADLKGRLSP